MKKALALFLLCIFLFNTMGYFIAFELTKFQIKEAIKTDIQNGVINNVVTTLVLKKAELAQLDWVEDSEFDYNGSRYDVIDRSEGKESTTFYCINDEQEFKLVSVLDQHVKDHVAPLKSTKNNSTKSITENTVKLYSNDIFSFKPTVTFLETVAFTSVSSNYTFDLIKANFQPPEFA